MTETSAGENDHGAFTDFRGMRQKTTKQLRQHNYSLPIAYAFTVIWKTSHKDIEPDINVNGFLCCGSIFGKISVFFSCTTFCSYICLSRFTLWNPKGKQSDPVDVALKSEWKEVYAITLKLMLKSERLSRRSLRALTIRQRRLTEGLFGLIS